MPLSSDVYDMITHYLADPVDKNHRIYVEDCIIFREFLPSSSKHVPITELIGYIDKIVMDTGREIMVK